MRTDTVQPAPTTQLAATTPTATTTRRPASTPPATEASAADVASPTRQLADVAGAAGAALLMASTLAWIGGDGSAELRAILMAWAFPITALGVAGIAARLEARAPTARAVVTALLAIGGAAGFGYAVEAAMVEHFGVERLIREPTPSGPLVMGLPGILFPLALMAVGALSARHGTLPRRQATLLALAGLLFPLSRIPEVPALALVADVALLAALAPVGLSAARRWRRRRSAA